MWFIPPNLHLLKHLYFMCCIIISKYFHFCSCSEVKVGLVWRVSILKEIVIVVILNIFYTISFPFVHKDQAAIGTNTCILIDLQAYTCISEFVYMVTHNLMVKSLSMNTIERIFWFIIISTQRVRCTGISRFK